MKKLFLVFIIFSSSIHAQECYQCTFLDWIPGSPKVEIPSWPLELIKVEKVKYNRNENASYCTRPVEMIDTIVIHHSEGSPSSTPEGINNYHLTRGFPNDPWYMIGYSFVINSPYPGSNQPLPRVTEGRPLGIIGSHAGSEAFAPMDSVQKKLWQEEKIVCGKTGEVFKVNPRQIKDGKIKANATTLGIVITGNYAPFSRTNPTGYAHDNPRHPTRATLRMAAKLSCQLQRSHPRIKNIKWHSFYNATECPGLLKRGIAAIKTMAKEYGCKFN